MNCVLVKGMIYFSDDNGFCLASLLSYFIVVSSLLVDFLLYSGSIAFLLNCNGSLVCYTMHNFFA